VKRQQYLFPAVTLLCIDLEQVVHIFVPSILEAMAIWHNRNMCGWVFRVFMLK